MKKLHIAVAVGAVCTIIGLTAFNIHKNQTEQEQKLNNFLESIKKDLPNGVVQENRFEQGLFHSDGEYKLTYNSGKESNKFTINYHFEHPLSSWFTNNTVVHATGKLEGKLQEWIKPSSANILEINGTVNKDNMNLSYTMPEMKLEMGKSYPYISLGQTQGTVISNEGMVKINHTVPHSSVMQDGKNLVDLNMIVLGRNFLVEKPDLGDFNIAIPEVKNATMNVSDIKYLTNINVNNNKYQLKSEIDIGKINVLTEKNGHLEFGYTLDNLNAQVVDRIQTTYKKYISNKQATKEEDKQLATKELSQEMYDLLQSGLSFKINKLIAKTTSGDIKFSTGFALLPTVSPNPISVSDNAKIDVNLEVNGQWAQLSGMYLADLIHPVDPKSVKLVGKYEKGVVTMNGSVIESPMVENFKMSLKNVDNMLKEFKH